MTDSTTSGLICNLLRRHTIAALDKPHLTFADIEPVIKTLSRSPVVRAVVVGHSFNGTPIYRLSMGNGPVTLLGWTQMHGDEPTATAAVLDWLSIASHHADTLYPAQWQDKISVHFVVMLNPDGASPVAAGKTPRGWISIVMPGPCKHPKALFWISRSTSLNRILR